MNNIFNGCSSLIELPDISKWEVNKVIFMNNMFNGCISLISLPDLSRRNINFKLNSNNQENTSGHPSARELKKITNKKKFSSQKFYFKSSVSKL